MANYIAGGFFMTNKPRQLTFLPEAKPHHFQPPWERACSLQELKEIVNACRRCQLRKGCKQVIFGEGKMDAEIVLIGEGPGRAEDELGRPFVGRAGQLLDNILLAVGLSRAEIFIGNIVKCRPPGNRTPTPDEVRTCLPFLRAQLRLIKPKIIVCLGALASQTLIAPSVRITRSRGSWVTKDGFFIMPTFHPAALLRDPRKKRPVWEDFQAIMERYQEIKTGTLPSARGD
jgi:uracil-DNA glycosylase family 4